MEEYVFFIGPRKTGTTSFYEVLKQADAPVSPTVKESFFFDQKSSDIETYQSRYSLDPSKPFAEISPSYFTSIDAIENIHSNFPNAKIIVTLREPLKRAISALSHVRRIGFLPQSWDSKDCQDNKHVQNIITASNYQHYINLWSEKFPGRVCIIKQIQNGLYDINDVKKVGEFVGVDFDPDIFFGTRANSAMEPRSAAFTGLVQKAKSKLANRGLFGTIRVLKKLKPLLYRPQSKATVDNDAITFFSAQLLKETEYFESLKSFSIR